ncbi:MAG TPA: hypothetical protein VG322_10180 [Candidatus Acidoferrales bacterium]|jgi:hypothetical protein|nr:hypothetical protein [Candidatus Acidoferrales bacterium]
MDSGKVVAQDQPSPANPHTQPSSGSATQLAGEDRRRSQRVLLRVRASIHVAIQGKPVTLETHTLSVNAHGALVAVKENLPSDTRLVLEHAATKERMACRVVRPPRETSEGFHTAIEFDSPDPDFWKIAFPPANWRAEEI